MRCSVHKSAAASGLLDLVVGLIVAAVISTSTGPTRRKPHSVAAPAPEKMAECRRSGSSPRGDNAVSAARPPGRRKSPPSGRPRKRRTRTRPRSR